MNKTSKKHVKSHTRSTIIVVWSKFTKKNK